MTHPLDTTAIALLALVDRLDQLAILLEGTPDFDYRWQPPGGVSGSVGAHVRHVLDHVAALLDADGSSMVTYDHRQRDVTLEQSRPAAIAALERAATDLRARAGLWTERPLSLQAIVQRGAAPLAVTSSLAREAVFVLQHTIHHQAIVALLLNARGISLPAEFGYAPSTPLRVAS